MSTPEDSREAQGTSEGNNEGQQQDGEPSGEISEEPTEVLDQDGASVEISADSAQATDT